jgi:hypothetical protein
MTRGSRFLQGVILSITVLCSLSFGQKFNQEHEKEDDPAGYAKWFMKSRAPRNTNESPASLLRKGTEQKMNLRASHLQSVRSAKQAGRLASGVGDANSVWVPLGPSPIVWNIPGNATESWTGRITAVAVDQTDSTGNTVIVGGAYGGVWRSTNAADPVPANIHWTSLTDDQPTLSIGALAIQPGNGNTILAGTGEPNGAIDSYYGMGILVTNDAGAHWNLVQQTSDATPVILNSKSISAIAFNSRPGGTNNVVAGVASPGVGVGGDDGVRGAIYSSDAGATWHAVAISDGGTPINDSSVMAVVYNPVENKFFITVRHHGVFVSSDQGHTFTKLATQPNAATLTEVKCPAVTTSGCPLYRAAMTVRYVTPGTEATATDEMYIWIIGLDASGNPTDLNLYQTKNGGSTWTQMSETGINAATGGDEHGVDQAWYDIYLGAVPNGAGTDLFAGVINIYKCSVTSSNPTCSTQAFKNLTHVYDGTCNTFYPNVHPDQHGFDYSGSNPKIVYFGNDGGMYRSLDETKLTNGSCTALNVFDSMNADLGSLAQFIWGSHKYNNPSELLGGTQDNGTMYVDSSLTVPGTQGWYAQLGGDGGYSAIDSNDNWFGTNTYVSIQKCPGGWVGCNAWQSLISKSQVDNDSSAFYTPWILDPQDQTKIIVGTCRVWRGPTVSANWTSSTITNALSHNLFTATDTACSAADNDVAALAAGGPKTSAGSQVIYASTSYSSAFSGGVFVTKNAGAPGTAPTAWTNITSSINQYGYAINGIAVDPQDSTGGTAVAAIQGFTSGPGKVWRTTNFGSSWTDISGNLPDVPANDVLVDPDNGNVIYVATDIGVFVTSDEATWVEVGPNTVGATGFLPNSTVFHIAIYENGGDKRLRAWTHGRGAWEAAIPSSVTGITVSPTSLSFSSTSGIQSAVQTVTVTNHDATAVTLGTPGVTGSDAPDFQIAAGTTTCGASIAASSTCAIAVAFTPPSVTSFSAALSFTTSDVATPTITIPMGGTGTAPAATDFTIDFGSNPTSATAKAGSSAAYNFNVAATPTGAVFNPAVTFACSGLPSKASCSFKPSSVTAAGGVVLTISTTATVASASPAGERRGSGPLLAVLAIPGLMFVLPGLTGRSRRKRLMRYLGSFVMIAAIAGMSACGGGGGSKTTTSNPIPGTPAGTYTVTITGTYGGATHMQAVTLTVN